MHLTAKAASPGPGVSVPDHGNSLSCHGKLELLHVLRSNFNTRDFNTRDIFQFFDHSSEPQIRIWTKIAGNASYKPPGAFQTYQGPDFFTKNILNTSNVKKNTKQQLQKWTQLRTTLSDLVENRWRSFLQASRSFLDLPGTKISARNKENNRFYYPQKYQKTKKVRLFMTTP